MSKRTNKSRKRSRRMPIDRGLGSPGINVIGNPFTATSEPIMRTATLDDVEDDCPLCQELRQQILSGNAPEVMVFE